MTTSSNLRRQSDLVAAEPSWINIISGDFPLTQVTLTVSHSWDKSLIAPIGVNLKEPRLIRSGCQSYGQGSGFLSLCIRYLKKRKTDSNVFLLIVLGGVCLAHICFDILVRTYYIISCCMTSAPHCHPFTHPVQYRNWRGGGVKTWNCLVFIGMIMF